MIWFVVGVFVGFAFVAVAEVIGEIRKACAADREAKLNIHVRNLCQEYFIEFVDPLEDRVANLERSTGVGLPSEKEPG